MSIPPPIPRVVRARLRDRNTGDLLVLMIAGTICFSVVAGGATIVIAEITKPNIDTSAAARTITGIINTLIGLLAGFLAGKTGSIAAASDEQQDRHDEQMRQMMELLAARELQPPQKRDDGGDESTPP
jgi:NhaP-type Na+/H+ or K+/H+ antiporter